MEIKSRYDGKVLYTAKTAADVRAAVVEAAAERADLRGANLQGAYLRGADLRGADLRGANLQGADLQGANLRGADLQDANLQGADLRGAYLRGAYLRGAYLRGADLRGAYLQDANLRGADLQGAVWEKVAAKLEKALQAMNDNGRHWIKGSMSKALEDGSMAYCSIGSISALQDTGDESATALALWLLGSVTAGPIEAFNDHPSTTWEDVQAVFGVAILHAKRLASKA